MGTLGNQFDSLCNKSVSQSWVKAKDNPNAYTDESRQETPRSNHYINHQVHRWLDLDPSMISGVPEVDLLPRAQQHFPTPPNSSSCAAAPHSRIPQSSADIDNSPLELNSHPINTVSSINPFYPSRTTNDLTYQQLVLYILAFEIGLDITNEEDVVFLAKSSSNNDPHGLLLCQHASTVESNASAGDCQYTEPSINAVLKQKDGHQETIDATKPHSNGHSLPCASNGPSLPFPRAQHSQHNSATVLSIMLTEPKSRRQQHNRKRKKSAPCHYCSRTFGRERDLKRHQNSVHDSTKVLYTCHCGFSTPRKDSLQRHIQRKRALIMTK